MTFPTHSCLTLSYSVNARVFSYIIAILWLYFSYKCFNKYASRAQVSSSSSSCSSLPHLCCCGGAHDEAACNNPTGRCRRCAAEAGCVATERQMCAMRTHVLAQCTICWSSSSLALAHTRSRPALCLHCVNSRWRKATAKAKQRQKQRLQNMCRNLWQRRVSFALLCPLSHSLSLHPFALFFL